MKYCLILNEAVISCVCSGKVIENKKITVTYRVTPPSYHHHADLAEPGEDFRTLNGRKVKERKRPRSVPRSKREKNCCSRGTSKSETQSNNWRKEQSSAVKQGKNAMMSSISRREE